MGIGIAIFDRLLCRSFPALERYELSSQARRAAYSVAANIVEGFGRRSPKDRLHFLHIAEASLTSPTRRSASWSWRSGRLVRRWAV